jgi:Zn-dependent protease with chaperone function
MNFFEAQARAKKRTSRLVLMFVLAVIGTVITMYFAALIAFGAANARSHHRYRSYNSYSYDDSYSTSTSQLGVWNPGLFAGVTFATLAVVGLGSMYKWSQFSAGGSAVAESVGARRVDPNTSDLSERRLLNVVEEMAIASGVPVPAVYIQDNEPGINAFAAGLTTNDAVVTVTRGTLEKLNRDELQGVIGHEFSHILNGDMRLNLRIGALIFGILVLGVIGRGLLWSSNGRSRDRNAGAIVFIGLALVVVGYVGYFFGKLIQAAVSRQREFLADASSVQFTRNPAGIANALKKIGGDEMGSTILHNQSAAMGHFFFSQAFASGVTGLWDTHPPLEQRIHAIEPNWDGKFVVPAAQPVREDATPSSRAMHPRAGNIIPPIVVAAGALEPQPSASASSQPLPPTTATRAVDAIGKLTPEQIANAQLILDSTPARLRTATQTHTEARVLLYGLLLNDGETRERQRATVARIAGSEARRLLDSFDGDFRQVRDEQRLPLVQLAMPALRQIPRNELQPFLATLDELIRADNQISAFEFALQRLLTNALSLGRNPRAAGVRISSLDEVTAEIATVLSVLAGASTSDPNEAPRAFAAGASQLPSIQSRLSFSAESASDLAAFDASLDKLATASLSIKERTLTAAAHVVQADGQVLITEFELLRAISAALDVPMPPLVA